MKDKKDWGEKLGRIEKFYDERINNFVGSTAGKWIIILLSLIWFGLAINFTTKITPLSEKEEFIDPEHELMIVFTKIGNDFPKPPQ